MTIAARLVGSVETTAVATTATTASGTSSASGSTFVVFAITADSGGFAATAVTDSKSNTYTLIDTTVLDSTLGVTGGLYYCQNGVGGASHTATVHNASASTVISGILIEITGGLTSGILDVHAAGNIDTASPFTSTSVGPTTQANEVVLAFMFDNRSTATAPTWGNSFASLVDLSNTSGITGACASKNVTATGTQQSSLTAANDTRVTSWIATFKELTSGDTLMGQACL